MRIEGGGVGLQAGGSETDVIMLVMSKKGVEGLLKSKFTLGGEASVAAGPVGRDTGAQTDATMRADILSWSRSRGVFGGLSLQGGTLRADEDANKSLYSTKVTTEDILTGKTKNSIPTDEFAGALGIQAVCNKPKSGCASAIILITDRPGLLYAQSGCLYGRAISPNLRSKNCATNRAMGLNMSNNYARSWIRSGPAAGNAYRISGYRTLGDLSGSGLQTVVCGWDVNNARGAFRSVRRLGACNAAQNHAGPESQAID